MHRACKNKKKKKKTRGSSIFVAQKQSEKYQYNKSDVVAHNGFKYRQYLTDIGVDTDSILQRSYRMDKKKLDVLNIEIQSIMQYQNVSMIGFPTVRSQTIFLNSYLRSNRHSQKKYNPETGEVL